MNECKFGPFRLWYIEDDENDAMLMKRAVAASGRPCSLTHFLDAAKAMATLETLAQPANEAPHLIITDLKMPGVNGIEFVKWLRASRFHCLPVIVFTASALPLDSLTAYRYGANSFATKPSDYVGLQTGLAHILSYWLDVCALHEHAPLLAEPESFSSAWMPSSH